MGGLSIDYVELVRGLASPLVAGEIGPVLLDALADRYRRLSAKRANGAGTDSKAPPPPPVRDRLNDTIHKIGGK